MRLVTQLLVRRSLFVHKSLINTLVICPHLFWILAIPIPLSKKGDFLFMKPSLPLCVDLDGTLLATDCLWESFVQGLKQNPFILFLVPFWLIRGKSVLKNKLAGYADFDVETLPENPRFLNWLGGQIENNRELYLVSASDQSLVSAVAQKFGFFKEAIGSSPGLNLRGKNKAKYLVERFGEGGFDYAGE